MRLSKVTIVVAVTVCGVIVSGFSTCCVAQESVSQTWLEHWGPSTTGDPGSFMALDGSDNVLVLGLKQIVLQSYFTVKYSPEGDTLWTRLFNSTGTNHERPEALALDRLGNVLVAGVMSGAELDIGTIKYSPTGELLWFRRFSAFSGFADWGFDISSDSAGNIYVTGTSNTPTTITDLTLIKYSPNGTELWSRLFNGSEDLVDAGIALAVDGQGNCIVVGHSTKSTSGADFLTIKFDSNGDTLWTAIYDGPGGVDDFASQIFVDDGGFIYVSGSSFGGPSDDDFATIKYTPMGDTVWVRRYDGPLSDEDRPTDLTVDISGNVIVTGNSGDGGGLNDIATVKYSSNGQELWVRRHDGPANANDRGNAITVDELGSVYVGGSHESLGASQVAFLIKYSSIGDSLWSVTRSSGNGLDFINDIGLDNSLNVIVTGQSADTSFGYTTVKYEQVGLGDSDLDGVIDSIDNCPTTFNPLQEDFDGDGFGDSCFTPNSTWPLVIVARDTSGNPVPGAGINLRVTDPDGLVIEADSMNVITNSIGLSAQYFAVTANDSIVISEVKKGTYQIEAVGVSELEGGIPGCCAIVVVTQGFSKELGPFDRPIFSEEIGRSFSSEEFGPFERPGSGLDTLITSYEVFVPGDANGDLRLNIADVTYLISWIFLGGPGPVDMGASDANCDGTTNIADVTFIIARIFSGGPAPGCD